MRPATRSAQLPTPMEKEREGRKGRGVKTIALDCLIEHWLRFFIVTSEIEIEIEIEISLLFIGFPPVTMYT